MFIVCINVFISEMSLNSDSAWQKVPVRKPKRNTPVSNPNPGFKYFLISFGLFVYFLLKKKTSNFLLIAPTGASVNQSTPENSSSTTTSENFVDLSDERVPGNYAFDTNPSRPSHSSRDPRPRKAVPSAKTLASIISKV